MEGGKVFELVSRELGKLNTINLSRPAQPLYLAGLPAAQGSGLRSSSRTDAQSVRKAKVRDWHSRRLSRIDDHYLIIYLII